MLCCIGHKVKYCQTQRNANATQGMWECKWSLHIATLRTVKAVVLKDIRKTLWSLKPNHILGPAKVPIRDSQMARAIMAT